VAGNDGRQRLGNRQDYVRMAIGPAQERRDVEVTAILVGAARLLSLGELPGRLAKPRGSALLAAQAVATLAGGNHGLECE
jgi:hypothetical protein